MGSKGYPCPPMWEPWPCSKARPGAGAAPSRGTFLPWEWLERANWNKSWGNSFPTFMIIGGSIDRSWYNFHFFFEDIWVDLLERLQFKKNIPIEKKEKKRERERDGLNTLRPVHQSHHDGMFTVSQSTICHKQHRLCVSSRLLKE